MKIVAMSDTHNFEVPNVPDGDVLIHAGDATMEGTETEVMRFAEWFNGLPHKHKLFVPGNHDWLFQRWPTRARKIMSPTRVLIDEVVKIGNQRFFGSPFVNEFCGWAFMEDTEAALRAHYASITDGDVVITHGPARGIMDRTQEGNHVGSIALREILQEQFIHSHIFGHIHEAHGQEHIFPDPRYVGGDYDAYNVAIKNRAYQPVNPVTVFKV